MWINHEEKWKSTENQLCDDILGKKGTKAEWQKDNSLFVTAEVTKDLFAK